MFTNNFCEDGASPMLKFRPLMLALCLSLFAVRASAQSPGDVGTVEPRPTSQPQGAHRDLLIYNVWVRPTAALPTEDVTAEATAEATLDVTGGYLTITNQTTVNYTLVSATTPYNEVGEIHESMTEGGMAQMSAVEGGLPIPAGETVRLEPGGFHLMLLGMTQDIYPGQAIPLTLTLTGDDDSRTELTVAALVTDFPPERTPLIVSGAFARIAPSPEQPLIPDLTPTPQVAVDSIALYFTVVNTDAPTQNLIGARIDFAGSVEVRESYFLDGVIATRPIDFAPIPVLSRLLLQPNGYHLYAADLTHIPEPGEAFAVTLLFDSGIELPVAFLMQ